MYPMLEHSLNLVRDFVNLWYPELCLACEEKLVRGESQLCTSCRLELPMTDFHLIPNNPVEKTFHGRVRIRRATSLLYFQKGGAVQNLMHHFKYDGHKFIGEVMGEWLGDTLAADAVLSKCDGIVPVPLHPTKLRLRGFNQSYWLAKGISNQLNVPIYDDVLLRSEHSESQTRKSRYNRWENVRSIFEVTKPNKISGKRVLLVDDVLTTGATLEACAQKLHEVDGVEVCIATLAYAGK